MGRRRVTQAGLAAILGKSQPYVSRRLSGDVAFDTDDLFALADHFGVSVGRLLGDAVAVGSDRFRRRAGEAAAGPGLESDESRLLRNYEEVLAVAVPA